MILEKHEVDTKKRKEKEKMKISLEKGALLKRHSFRYKWNTDFHVYNYELLSVIEYAKKENDPMQTFSQTHMSLFYS